MTLLQVLRKAYRKQHNAALRNRYARKIRKARTLRDRYAGTEYQAVYKMYARCLRSAAAVRCESNINNNK